MTTFSRILLNPNLRGGRKLIVDPQSMHAAVRASFPPDLDESSGRVLWRLDSAEHEHVLYIVAPEMPELGHIIEQAGWATRPPQRADYTPLLDSLRVGQEWRFRVRANPTKSVKGERARGVVRPLAGQSGQIEWLRGQALRHGFEIPLGEPGTEASALVTISGRRDLGFDRRSRDNGQRDRVSIRAVRFDGILRVTDIDAMRNALVSGIGRGKAYGCGLLTLRKISG